MEPLRPTPVLFLLCAAAAAATAQPPAPVGDWQGTLKAGGQELRLVLHITRDAGGKLAATMDSVDQGATGLKFTTVALTGRELQLLMPALRASYKGTLSEDGKTLDGTWTQGRDFPLTFELGKAPVVRLRPQHPKPPFPYRVEEVAFGHVPGRTVEASFTTDVDAGVRGLVKLAGTLTVPRGDGPFPAAVLISGSGPQDRDETLLGHKPFLVLADHLTRSGIAVLRYDDRGTAGSTGTFGTATSQDFADDAEAAFRYLRTRKEIAGDKVGLIGHSEGGLIAPLVAARTPAVAYIVLMAGPGVPGDQVIGLQSTLIARANGADEAAIEATAELNAALFAALRAEPDVAKARAAAGKILRSAIEAGNPAAGVKVEDMDAAVRTRVARLTSPWMRYFLSHDPRTTLRRVRCPVLAINGVLDLQVDAAQNLGEIEKALRAGGNEDVEVLRLPGLNHLFQKAETGSPAEYGKIEQTIDDAALSAIAGFVKKRVAAR